ncbi:hypothetical protein GGR42_000504 [Saonia flava]|uniref:DinB-like domain-containing protein n=1 Tax=Saonia flava TaxID=523696 RepID=A0A846QU44_9FLAO|nr:DinB family protein [Saonia flava]NJB70042.1 hypothetical protein [Saonia flava]
MKFSLEKSLEILEKTPETLEHYLGNLSTEWLTNNEGKDTWSPYDVLGHLLFGEKTDWMVRIQIIMSNSENKVFKAFDRFAQLNENQNRPIGELLKEFYKIRAKNLSELKSLQITEQDLKRIGYHPELGEVTLQQLIAAWVVHDLGHIAQISRVMAKQYKTEVGSWKEYLGILEK